ncbi:MAG: UDP-N-acetylmuramoyl-L-alanyl-D-glutamate--2,6-diaminopimelate ligase [Chloroflexia bacterium]|nr:UDP-N-acetylmuramoyl-L-alanyl-D-glutamate--2,6-diaminopimelate ligase [Chloroflexia bacterium]
MDQLPHTDLRRVSLGALRDGLREAELHGGREAAIAGIQYDSRLIRPGDLFAALPGADFDGHNFIAQADANGAAALLVERLVESRLPQLVVADSRAALASVAAEFYSHPSQQLHAIGITGTDGKTTTCSLIDHILRHGGITTGSIGTLGIKIGDDLAYQLPHQTTPESNLVQGYLREMVEHGVTHPVIEATSHGLAMHRLDSIRFEIAAVTNMTHEHLEYHKTVENYWRTKSTLVEWVAAKGGVVVLNADDPGAISALRYATGARVVRTSALGPGVEIAASDVSIREGGTSFVVSTVNGEAQIHLPLIGGFNVDNALIAIGVSLAAGVDLQAIAQALSTAPGVPGRLQRLDEGQPFGVVVDYAHTPESLRKILGLLRTLHQDRIIVVSGSGGERDATKRPLQGAVCAELADLSIFANEDPRNEDPERILEDIATGARNAGGVEGSSFHKIVDRRVAIERAFAEAQPGDCVLLAGKGHERSIIVRYEHTPWDEAAVARELLRERGKRRRSIQSHNVSTRG